VRIRPGVQDESGTPRAPAPGVPLDELSHTERLMAGLFKGVLAGWGASKLGGGCITTVIVFILLFWLLSAVF
jgi:hypothetical protein